MIAIKDLTFGYRKNNPVFKNLNLEITDGGIYGLLGKNGSGKSTLLHLLAGMLTPDDGEINFNGTNVRLRLPSTLCDTFVVPEEFDLPPVSMHEFCKLNSPFYPNFNLDDLLANLSVFNLSPEQNLGTLSMGQKKKAFICFALACNTSLLILDEPTNGLDLTGKAEFRRFIASHMDTNRTIIISTHQVHDVERLLDNIIIIGNQGVIVNAPVETISQRLKFFSNPKTVEDNSVLFCQPTLGGFAHIALRDEDDDETELNLESLFAFGMEMPEKLGSLFSKNSQKI